MQNKLNLANVLAAFIVFGSIALWVVVMPPAVIIPTVAVLAGWLGWQVRRTWEMRERRRKR